MNAICNDRPTFLHIELLELTDRREIPLHELERQATTALQARDDFVSSRLPSSVLHGLGRMASVALKAVGAAGCNGGFFAAIGAAGNFQEFILLDQDSIWKADFKQDAINDSLVSVVSFAASAYSFKGARYISNWIDQNDAHWLEKLQSDVDSTQHQLAIRALESSEYELVAALDKNILQVGHLINAMKDDDPKTESVMAHILDQGKLTQPAVWAAEKAQMALSGLGNRLVGELATNTARLIDKIEQAKSPESYLALLALASTAMITEPPAEFGEYLARHPDVAKKTVQLMKSIPQSQANQLVVQHERGRMAGLTRGILNAAITTN